jgi:putative membrane protein
MKRLSTVTATALLAAASVAGAQTTQTPTDPSAASSPHQRQTTGTDNTEAPATTTNGANPSTASTPSQRATLKGSSQADLDAARTAGATPATFVATAAQDGLTEVALGKVAESNSSNPDIKQFAQKMVQDHGQADALLAQIAKVKGLTVPTQLDAKHKAMVTAMSNKSGAAFDSAYAEHMVKAHAKAIALFQSAAQSSDSDMAAFANKMLPTLQEHQQMADSLERANGTRRTAAAPASNPTTD